MNTINFYFRIYFLILAQYFKAKMQFRVDFIISSTGMIISNAAGVFAFWVIFRTIPLLAGWSFYELVFMYAYSLLALTPMQLFFDNVWNLRDHVCEGTFIKYYFKPLNMLFYYTSEVFDLKSLSQLVFSAVLFVVASTKLGIEWNLFKLCILLITLFSSSLVMISLMLMAASTGFWFINVSSVVMFVSRLRELSRYPMTIFDGFFRFLFTFIIPIGFIAFYPSQFFLRPGEISLLVYVSPAVGMLLFLAAYTLWKKGVNSYSGTGS